MQYLIKKNTAAFLLIAAANLVVAFAAYFVLPPKFFYDAAIIVYDNGNEIGFFGSYPVTILLYKISGLRYLPYPVIALIQFPILLFILYKIGVPDNFEKINVKNILVYLGIVMIAIFTSMPSKEFITFLYVSPIVFMCLNNQISLKKTILYTVLLLLVFGVFYRPYYALIPIIGGGMYLISLVSFKNKTIKTIFYGLLIAVFLSFSHGILKGKYLSEISRELVNSDRMGSSDANSIIISPVKTDTWYGEAVGIFYGFFTVNIPVNGLKHIFSPQIIVFIIWQLLLFYILIVRFSKCLRERKKYPKELLILLIIFSFFIVQGVFEPDLGTAVRHKIGIFPLIYFALYYESFRKELQ
ncbi:hypothetical protein [Flavobacterium reichenbachii]|uniref:Glycosyltransferase RgtA/B/C/D-like domain-containing protein n=1 Tax=Flavobacterium reichenbachii TaxID=362418 RepID=A0A085ZSK3_9FLAO|nr:hypothetical protein [Flavobacterium reichenbachii]KFF07417.1 hypothetical protein IW19_18735 [Flavobacterium reichenbachii]OXB13102.1 hypothetical protein B0A68_15115 [Flavobacterium reichenbachii]